MENYSIYRKLSINLGRRGFRVLGRSLIYGDYSVELEGLNDRLDVYENEKVIISTSLSMIGIRKIINYFNSKNIKRKYKFSVNSTNFTSIRAISNLCKKLELNPLYDPISKLYQKTNHKSLNQIIEFIMNNYESPNSLEAWAILLRLRCAIPQGKLKLLPHPCSRYKSPMGYPKYIGKFRLESSSTHLNCLLKLLKLKQIKRKDLKFTKLNLNIIDTHTSDYYKKVIESKNKSNKVINISHSIGDPVLITKLEGFKLKGLISHVAIEYGSNKLIIESSNPLEVRNLMPTSVNYEVVSVMPITNILILL